MKTLFKLEELGALLLGVYLFSTLGLSWWWFIGLFFTPDIGMLGYLVNPKAGASSYNLFHLKSLGIVLFLVGLFLELQYVELVGVVLFAHAAFDRIVGYGLKYERGFKFTHLGEIGN